MLEHMQPAAKFEQCSPLAAPDRADAPLEPSFEPWPVSLEDDKQLLVAHLLKVVRQLGDDDGVEAVERVVDAHVVGQLLLELTNTTFTSLGG